MAGRRRGARSGRGWDALPPRPARTPEAATAPPPEFVWPDGAVPDRPDASGPHNRPPDGSGPHAHSPDASGPRDHWPDGSGPHAHSSDREDRPATRKRAAGGQSGTDAGRDGAAGRSVAGGQATREPGEVAREICLNLLSVRPRTRAELATALHRRGIETEVVTEILERYSEVGIIDDAAFARAWVASRHHGKGLARRALAGELRRRGVDADTVRDAVDELDGDTEAETARELVTRKLRTSTGRTAPDALVRRLVGMLARKGYSPGLAYRVVKEVLADDERTAEVADQLDPDALAEATLGDGAVDAEPAEGSG